MKTIIMVATLCVISFAGLAQVDFFKKELLVQQVPLKPVLIINCNSDFRQPKLEYKTFIEYMLRRSNRQGIGHFLNFHIKYTTVHTSDSALRNTGRLEIIPSLTADFLVNKLDCSSIIADNIPFTTLTYETQKINVMLAANLGILKLKNTENDKIKTFYLKPLDYGVFTGSVTTIINGTEVKETVVVVLTREEFFIGG